VGRMAVEDGREQIGESAILGERKLLEGEDVRLKAEETNEGVLLGGDQDEIYIQGISFGMDEIEMFTSE
jgi:hypothetical protein